jgi:ferric-dicitrate binding protein FerR (iron transport regulator)
VILNAGSTIHYSNDFNLSNRDLDLNGEAYFKVAKNPGLPFVVSAGEVEIIATGTEFNVKAYPEESTVETTLIEGAVEITNSNAERKGAGFIDLIPNQKAIFYKGEERYHLENIEKKIVKPEPVETFLEKVMISPKTDVEKTVAWTQGKLIFRGETLENMCVDLQRKYNVNFFFIEEDLKNYRFTGILLDETLEQVLEVIKLAAPVDFTIEGKTVYLLTDVKQLDGYRKELK